MTLYTIELTPLCYCFAITELAVAHVCNLWWQAHVQFSTGQQGADTHRTY